MAESTITTKGQCVVPKKIRDYMRLNPGDKIDFVIREDGEVYVRPVILDARELKGQMKKPGRKPVSLKEMEKAVRKRRSIPACYCLDRKMVSLRTSKVQAQRIRAYCKAKNTTA